ncbi:MAG: hypothetical protein LUQ65_10255, partial [Candidatus Helarchaeota archaeon]|nr:hypothetical protein [Candidatus Helarchaeota archaeon]
WHMRLEFATIGNGTIAPAEDDSGANSYYDFTYTRDQLATDISPVLKGTCEAPERDISGYTNIILRDAGGLPMSGQVDVPAYTTIQDEGVPLTQREVINFKGAGVTAADNAGTGVTDVTIPGGGGGGDVVGPAGATDSDICEFDTATGKLIKDGNLAHADVADAVSKKHVAATAGTGIDVAGQVISLDERNANLVLFPEYAGATMSPSGANNNPGIYGMTSDFEAIGTSIYNYYEWKSSITTGLQSYDINVKIPMPFNFTDLQVGVSVALTMDIKTEENDEANDSIDITLQRDGNAATSALTDQHSAVAATWVAVGFDETDAVLAALAAGDILNVTIRMYSQNSKYPRVGKINLQVKLQ